MHSVGTSRRFIENHFWRFSFMIDILLTLCINSYIRQYSSVVQNLYTIHFAVVFFFSTEQCFLFAADIRWFFFRIKF